jgi:hypothetical protein
MLTLFLYSFDNIIWGSNKLPIPEKTVEFVPRDFIEKPQDLSVLFLGAQP